MCKINQIIRACMAIELANEKSRKRNQARRVYTEYPLSNYQLDCLLAFDRNARYGTGINPITDCFQVETD